MKRFIHSLALLIFCIHTGCFGNPVRKSAKDHVWIYDYAGQIETTTTACNESLARWTISGDLSLYYHEGYMVAKLDGVKTSMFNGLRSQLEYAQEKEIPKESEAILQPFVIKKTKDKSLSILLNPNEPLWSINMKKAIANHLHFDVDIFAKEKNSAKPNEKIKKPFQENSIYGKCNGDYTMKKLESITIYDKKLNYWSCTDRPIYQETNTLKPLGSVEMFEFLDYESENHLVMNERLEAMWKGSSKTNVTYKILPSSPYSLNAIQQQTFSLRESFEAEDLPDISKLTDERNLIYEFGDEHTSGKHAYEKDQSVLAKYYLDNYDIFHKNFEHPTLANFDVRNGDPIDKMYSSMITMNDEGLKNIEKANRDKEDSDFNNLHYDVLAHVGTNATVKYLSKFFQTVTNKGKSAQLLKVLATLPQNIRWPTDDILANLEPFMDLKNIEQQTVKDAAILSFASAVGRACRKKTISKEKIEKYVEIYNREYLSGASTEIALTHLLGLINMAECLDADFMNTIITNTTEPSRFRVLGITGFKPYLRVNQPGKQAFDTYWPIIQNKSEPFDVRVAVLDLMLVAYPSKKHLDLIVDTYSKHFNDPEDKQLANYLLTSLHSLQNTNWYFNNYIGAKATAFVKNNNIPSYPKTWATGYYRLSFTDNEPNQGAYFDTRLITDPKTNMVNAIQLSFNHFVSSFDFGTYNLYLKFDGLLDWSYALHYIKIIQDSSVPELLKALKENKFELKGISENFRIDIVLFVDNVAVYSKYINYGNKDESNSIGKELEEFVSTPLFLSFPIKVYTHIPSELGTPIQISTYLHHISKKTFDEGYLKYRSTMYFQNWIECNNPLVDIKIASYKYYVDEKNLNIKFKENRAYMPSFTWESKNDSYTQFWDNMMGTAVEEEDVLVQYCPKCEPYNELVTNIPSEYTQYMRPLGFKVVVKRHSHKENHYPTLSEFIDGNIHQSNVDAFPYATPIVFLAHFNSHNFWLHSDLQRGSYRSHPLNGPNATAQTTFTFNVNDDITNRFSMTNHMGVQADIKTKDPIDDKVLYYGNFTYEFSWMPNPNDEEGNTQSVLCQMLNVKLKAAETTNSFKFCVNRKSFFPGIRSDKLSLESFEAASGKTVLISAKNIEDDEDCIPAKVHIFSEVYSISDKNKILEDANMKKDYDKCLFDSKDLKFTAPTAECKRISSRLAEYDDYKVYLKSVTYSEDGDNNSVEFKQPFFESSRDGKDKLKLALLKLPLDPPDTEIEYYNHTIYHPGKTTNPNELAYNDHDSAVPRFATSTCTISPSEIEQFSGKYIPNTKKEWLAFAECYNVSTRGVIGHTIDDKHVGFTFYSNEHELTATVKNGKAEVKINGTVQNEFNDPFQHFRLHHLAENVFHVRDKIVDIYYNTEYISVKVPSRYDKLLCGVCTQEPKLR